MMTSKLTRKEVTAAVKRYARKHGFYHRTVRTVTSLRRSAIAEWLVANSDSRTIMYVRCQ